MGVYNETGGVSNNEFSWKLVELRGAGVVSQGDQGEDNGRNYLWGAGGPWGKEQTLEAGCDEALVL